MKLLDRMLVVLGLAVAVAFARPAAADEFKLPDGKVAVHYFRGDGSYDGWGLHVWESFQKKEEAGDEFGEKQTGDRPLKGVSWFKPLPQSGKDDFGVYWLLDEKEFENGRVNYIIHKGDKKDQCNKDMFWLIKDSKQAWVNTGDCKVYLSKADALKARK
jgi:Bacterial pullanase-associated domain